MKLTEAKLKELIIEALEDNDQDDPNDDVNMVKNIASIMGDGSPENMENALFLVELVDEDMTELGRYLSKDAAFYLYNRASYRASHPEWLSWLITSQDTKMLRWVLQDWYKHKDRLTDEHLIKMYNSAPRAHKSSCQSTPVSRLLLKSY